MENSNVNKKLNELTNSITKIGELMKEAFSTPIRFEIEFDNNDLNDLIDNGKFVIDKPIIIESDSPIRIRSANKSSTNHHEHKDKDDPASNACELDANKKCVFDTDTIGNDDIEQSEEIDALHLAIELFGILFPKWDHNDCLIAATRLVDRYTIKQKHKKQ